MKPRVLITRVLPEPALEVVRQACEVQLDLLDQPLTPTALRQAVVDKQGVLCLVTDRIDAPVLDAAAGLKVVSNVAVGYDNIDVAAATQRGITWGHRGENRQPVGRRARSGGEPGIPRSRTLGP